MGVRGRDAAGLARASTSSLASAAATWPPSGQPEGGPPIAVWNTYIWVESADEAAVEGVRGRRSRRDGPVRRHRRGPHGRVHRSRRRRVLRLAGRGSTRARGSSTNPARSNFNSLNTRDVEGAKSFYGSVFGWETLLSRAAPRCGGWPATATSWSRAIRACASGWRRPRRSGGLRGRRRDAQSDRGRPTRRPRALERDVRGRRRRRDGREGSGAGRRVVVAPFDAPWVRMTVITDPQGATFTASKFVPENHDLGHRAASTLRAA